MYIYKRFSSIILRFSLCLCGEISESADPDQAAVAVEVLDGHIDLQKLAHEIDVRRRVAHSDNVMNLPPPAMASGNSN